MMGGSVIGNNADDNGGGIYSSDSSSLNIKNVTISNNVAGDNGGGLNIRLKEDATIENCTIEDNSSSDYGGGFRMDADGRTLTIKNTKIENNSAADDGGGIYLRYGTIIMSGDGNEKTTIKGNGSFNDGGGAKITSKTTFTATNVTISENKASTEEGGGIKNYGDTTLVNCTIEQNEAAEQGGGIYNDKDDGSAGKLTLNGCTIKNNITQRDGGGIYSDNLLTIIGGEISNNTADERGGGVFVGGDSSNTSVQGAPVIKDNVASETGNNLFLRSGRKLSPTGALDEAADICVDLEKGVGGLTSGYKTTNGTSDPTKYFTFAKGYELTFTDTGEVEITSDWSTIKERIENAKSGETIPLDKDYGAKPSDDRIKIDGDKNITVDLKGFTLNRNRASETDDGHVLEVFGGSTLTITDSSNEKTGAIIGGWSERGGGIYVNKDATLNLQGGKVTGNRADTNGGGVFAKGAVNIAQGSTIESNKTDGSGGGVYLDSGSALNLEGGKLEKNNAEKKGGGIAVNGNAAISVKGAPVVSGNHALKNGHDVYLPSGGLFTIKGSLTEGAKLGVALEDTWGTFTRGYGDNNGADEPTRFFTSTEGYAIYTLGGEAVMGLRTYGESENTNPFISWNNQVNTDPAGLSSQNWMSGVSGERYLHEINIPGTHDSGMNNMDNKKISQGITALTGGAAFLVLIGAIALGVTGAYGSRYRP